MLALIPFPIYFKDLSAIIFQIFSPLSFFRLFSLQKKKPLSVRGRRSSKASEEKGW